MIVRDPNITRLNTTTHHIELVHDDVMQRYADWQTPIVIISDGAYGIKGFPGDPPTTDDLAAWYQPHIEAWSHYATPQTTLWFWNTELGWATIHPLLLAHGWQYRACHIWDKGIGHVAGNSNTQSLRKLPIVTEVCVQYIKQAYFMVDGQQMTMQTWLRYEWLRTGLPLYKTNEACGVKNAATRKYFTADHLWYYPPPDAFEKFVAYANQHGDPSGKPYFSADGQRPITRDEWETYRAKFYCPVGITNVWQHPPLNGNERLKVGSKALHLNQKPLALMERLIEVSSDAGDVVWEPFAGLASGAIAAHNLRRTCYAAEIDALVYETAAERLRHHTPRLI